MLYLYYTGVIQNVKKASIILLSVILLAGCTANNQLANPSAESRTETGTPLEPGIANDTPHNVPQYNQYWEIFEPDPETLSPEAQREFEERHRQLKELRQRQEEELRRQQEEELRRQQEEPKLMIEYFVYLLENIREVATIQDLKNSGTNFPWPIYNLFFEFLHKFEINGLVTAEIEVVDYKQVDIETLTGEKFPSTDIHEGSADIYSYGIYEIAVVVKSGGALNIPEGPQKWLMAFSDFYRDIEFLLPYSAGTDRLEVLTNFFSYRWRVIDDAFHLSDVAYPYKNNLIFSSAKELPVSTIIFCLMARDNTEANYSDEYAPDGHQRYYGTIVTQEELDARAKKYFGLDHLDGKETWLYNPERDFYHNLPWDYTDLTYFDILKVVQDGDMTYVYYDPEGKLSDYYLANSEGHHAYEESGIRRIIKYTYAGECLVSAEIADSADFAANIIGTEFGK